MSKNPNKTLSIWLFTTCVFITMMVIYGGYVRLTRSGLSIVEWQVVTGMIPPLTQDAWQAEFDLYQQTPEYQKVNTGMSLDAYKSIYYREYIHRLLGRLTGTIYVVPLFIFLFKGIIPRHKRNLYLIIGLLFAAQGFMGWCMVKSGLVDQPAVSHYRLTSHLLIALLLLGLCFWNGLDHAIGAPAAKRASKKSALFILSFSLIIIIVIQISYGGLVAGLKAGYISDTFPFIFGYLIPPGLLSMLQPWYINLVDNMVTVHFVHRWLAFGVLILAGVLYYWGRTRHLSRDIQLGAAAEIALVTFQILMGLGVILWHIPVWLAIMHQGTALLLFVVALFINHQLPGSRPAGQIN
jgi:cytochrome c oxidase assembly protein subunit 15